MLLPAGHYVYTSVTSVSVFAVHKQSTVMCYGHMASAIKQSHSSFTQLNTPPAKRTSNPSYRRVWWAKTVRSQHEKVKKNLPYGNYHCHYNQEPLFLILCHSNINHNSRFICCSTQSRMCAHYIVLRVFTMR